MPKVYKWERSTFCGNAALNNYFNKTKSSQTSTCAPASRSHKASIVLPKNSRESSKGSPVSLTKTKPYNCNSNFQCGKVNCSRSRNPSQSNNYFTTGNRRQKPNSNENLTIHKLSRTNDEKDSRGSDGFKEIEVFTFAKQTPKVKNPAIPVPVMKTPSNYKKAKDKPDFKGSAAKSSKLSSANTVISSKTRSSEKKALAVSRQITSQASKMLSYNSKSKFLSKQKESIVSTPESSIRNIKQGNLNTTKKSMIQSMLTNKLTSVSNFKVRVKDNQPKVMLKPSRNLKPLSSSSRGQVSGTPICNQPKSYKTMDKENVSRNLSSYYGEKFNAYKQKSHTFSPIQSDSGGESDDSDEDYQD